MDDATIAAVIEQQRRAHPDLFGKLADVDWRDDDAVGAALPEALTASPELLGPADPFARGSRGVG